MVVLPAASPRRKLKSGLPFLRKFLKQLHTSECIRSELPWNSSIQRPWLVDVPSHAVWSGFRSRRVAKLISRTCDSNNLQFYGLYLLIKGYLLLNCRLLEPQVGVVGLMP